MNAAVKCVALLLALLPAAGLGAAELRLGEGQAVSVTSGESLTLRVPGSGMATLYLFGPAGAARRTVERGSVALTAEELARAGEYAVIVDGRLTRFFVQPGEASRMNFLARPSRVPAASEGAITGTAFVLDAAGNLVTAPQSVRFRLASGEDAGGAHGEERRQNSRDGVAWVRLNSSHRGGPARFTASLESGVEVVRVVDQTAGDPCRINMTATAGSAGSILVETAPISDCAGNPVPDGTIVTFTSVEPGGRSTVDARIKRGRARAELPSSTHATLSVAAGVIAGNEIHWEGGR